MFEAWQVQKEIGFPTIIRPSFTLGGTGGGIAYNREEFEDIVQRGLDASPTTEVLLEESVLGWKEFEMEVIRDKKDNCIIVCAIENVDPMGVHTGDSITVAPTQSLTDKEYQQMRDCLDRRAAQDRRRDRRVERAVRAGSWKTGRFLVIEMNPRVSRSSALASKATGFPIAKVAAKLAVGYTLDELDNEITGGATPASFEPSIDYVVTKIPRFAFEKFPGANARLTTQMKAVGEVMAMGRTFKESLQKGAAWARNWCDRVRPGHRSAPGLKTTGRRCARKCVSPGRSACGTSPRRCAMACQLEEVYDICRIDRWFLVPRSQQIIASEGAGEGARYWPRCSRIFYTSSSAMASADERIATLTGLPEKNVRSMRYKQDLRPVFKRVDSCAAEFESATAYMYSTYEQQCESEPTDNEKIMILGGGPNRIGQGIEFDYCCVHASFALKEAGFETIMVNCNPETVSTDYDTSDRLYFEPLTLENVLEIVEKEKPKGVIVQYGGQTPLKLARDLEEAGVPIIGTSPDSIDLAEDRERFQALVEELGLRQPPNRTARTEAEAEKLAEEVGYPLVVRPSYVLGGRAMEIVFGKDELREYMTQAVSVSNESPVLLDHFLDSAVEVDVDAIADGNEVIIGGIMEHIEQAGVHSGDSGCSLPPYSLSEDTQSLICQQVR